MAKTYFCKRYLGECVGAPTRLAFYAELARVSPVRQVVSSSTHTPAGRAQLPSLHQAVYPSPA